MILFNSTLRNCPPPNEFFYQIRKRLVRVRTGTIAAVNSQVQESKDQHAAGTVEWWVGSIKQYRKPCPDEAVDCRGAHRA